MGPKQKPSKIESDGSTCSASAFANEEVSSDDPSYRLRRDRNNVAVKKSREKSRQKARETADKISRLRQENEDLELRTVELARELRTLKDVLLSRAGRRSEGSAEGRLSNSTTSCVASSSTSSSSLSKAKVVLADPQTVRRDHEYIGGSATGTAVTVDDSEDSCGGEIIEVEESIVSFEAGDYYISSG